MNKESLNLLVYEYRNGNETALDEIFRKVNPLIERASQVIEKVCDEPTKFDCRVILKIKRAMEDPKVRDFAGYVKTIIGNEKSDFLKRRKRKREDITLSALAGDSEEGLGYQLQSNENTEHDVLLQERVTLLAQGNPKKKLVLLQWSKGADDKSISKLLAQLYGGKAESHRKFIQRFKTECRQKIEDDLV